MARVWIIGESNPYQAPDADPDHYYALFPEPDGCAGHRLCAKILGMSRDEYLDAFERRNLLDGPKWSAPAARSAADRLLAEVVGPGDGLVLCGARVSAAFADYGVLYDPPSRTDIYSSQREDFLTPVRALVIPHPSGLCRAWNDPAMILRVREAVSVLRIQVNTSNAIDMIPSVIADMRAKGELP